ncbi:MAG: hypothetical protein ACRDF4_05805 [Rhabdochlamydiaceae bacterium]
MRTLFLDTFGVTLRVHNAKLVIEDRRLGHAIEEIDPDSNPIP